MVDLHAGVCSNCDRQVPVAACCIQHQIPICADCYMALNAGDGVCRVEGVMRGKHPSMDEGQDQAATGLPDFEQAVLSDVPIGPIPEQEVVMLSIQRVVLDRLEDNGKTTQEPVAVVRMQLAANFQCEGFGEEGTANYHAPHLQHVMGHGEMVMGKEMTEAMIKGLEAVRDDGFQKMRDGMMDEELKGMTGDRDQGGGEDDAGRIGGSG